MKHLILLAITALLLTLATVASAQTSLLPTLQAVRAEYPADWSHEQRGSFLNKVAYIHRAEGWGLLHKPGGNRCPTPQHIDVSCDYLVYRPTLQGFDVLADENTPVWRMGDSFVTSPERWIPPVITDVVIPNPGTPVPNPGTDIHSELSRLPFIQQLLAEIRQQALEDTTAIREDIAAHDLKEDGRWEQVTKAIVKFGGPAAAAFYAAWRLKGDGQ